MSTIELRKATRIEGSAGIRIEVADGRVKSARFMVEEFRGFERMLRGRRVECVPHLVSRVCGLCSVSHQVASLQAIEDALGIEVPEPVLKLRSIALFADWVASHALSYFYLTMPDFVGAGGGIFELTKTHPEVTADAVAVRRAGQRIAEIVCGRAVHPVSMGIGRFVDPPTSDGMTELRELAAETKERVARLVEQVAETRLEGDDVEGGGISFPEDQPVNLVTYDGADGRGAFLVHDPAGRRVARFDKEDFEANVSEMRAEWSLAKFPYLTEFGFPAGIMLVGPLSRVLAPGGILTDADVGSFALAKNLRSAGPSLTGYDSCRLLEIYWAAKRILDLSGEVAAHLDKLDRPVDVAATRAAGRGLGVLEAPRGVLVHSYLVKDGIIERARFLVATQFNNAFINLLIKDLAQEHIVEGKMSEKGDRLIGRCVRLFDPCLSCATQ